jgi:hypothetical protein
MYVAITRNGAFCDTMTRWTAYIPCHGALCATVLCSADVRAHHGTLRREETSMTTGLDTRPTNVVEDAAPRKSRSGTETRRRSEHMTLRLLPQEKDVAQVVADEFDMPSIQALIVDACQPLMSPGALAALAVDRESLQALAKQHGISEVQALLLQALTSPADPSSGQVAC